MDFKIEAWEKEYLREYVKGYLELANLPIMRQREKLWYAHNSLQKTRPMIVMETGTFQGDITNYSYKCTSPAACQIESFFITWLSNYELAPDDRILPLYYPVAQAISILDYNLPIKTEYRKDQTGKNLGFRNEHPIKDLMEDYHKLSDSVYSYDKEYTYKQKEFAESIIGDLIDVKLQNSTNDWYAMITGKAVGLCGLENLMYFMMDYPEKTKELLNFITDQTITFLKWQEKEGLLTLNNGNHYAGAGSYGFTNELPQKDFDGKVRLKDLWLNVNSQESVGLSPDMYKEFVYPCYEKIAKLAGLTYYGCCEPVHEIWDDCLKNLPNLRKVSISAWCNEDIMGEKLRGSNVIYSRKPSPNYMGVDKVFDEKAFAEHIKKTAICSSGCNTEIIFRDVYTLCGDKYRAKKAIEITRNVLEQYYTA
jgi:hypothetical protein